MDDECLPYTAAGVYFYFYYDFLYLIVVLLSRARSLLPTHTQLMLQMVGHELGELKGKSFDIMPTFFVVHHDGSMRRHLATGARPYRRADAL